MKKLPKDKPLFDPSEFLNQARWAYTHDLSQNRYRQSEYHSIVRDRWLMNFDKKFLLPGDDKSREDKAYAKFLAVNEEMRLFNESPFRDVDVDTFNIIETAKHLIKYVIGPCPDLEQVALRAKNSLGTSIGVPFWDTSPERKFSWPISMTRSMEPVWDAYLAWDKDLSDAITCVNESEGNSSPRTIFTQGSRGCTVLKNNDINRFISVEAVVNMFFQHGLAAEMEDNLSSIGLNFDADQEFHRKLAMWGSVHNRLATIDFSSMSDRVSLGLCQYLLPRDWYEALLTVRSPFTLIKGEWHPCHMISTMGNVTTFPLETLILWALAVATAQSFHKKPKKIPLMTMDRRKAIPYSQGISVYGDDCIMPTTIAPRFLEVCIACGFQPNDDKSFYKNEFFRESCGGDFYHGRDVRPLFLAAFPAGRNKRMYEAYLYTTINSVISKYRSYFGDIGYLYDSKLLHLLFDMLERVTKEILFVPVDFPTDSGVTSLPDIGRFIRAYDLYVGPVLVNKSGMLSFSYLKFEYSNKKDLDGQLRYALSLKQAVRRNSGTVFRNHFLDADLEKPVKDRNIRKRGTYVLARSRSIVSYTEPTTLKQLRSRERIIAMANKRKPRVS